jgi:hypothetical protein
MICEYFDRESETSRCFGPDASAVMKGRETGADRDEHSSALAASAACGWGVRWRVSRQ